MGKPEAPRCAGSSVRRPAKCVMSHAGRYVAKLASRMTAKMVDASNDVAIVVYGSVRMGRFRRLDFGAEPGLCDGESGRRKKYGSELATTEDKVVVVNVRGLIL